MKTNNITYLLVSLFAYLMAGSVILAHTHATDVVKGASHDAPNAVAKTDVSAKAIADLHNHIDKTSLKNVMKTSADTTAAARRRELSDTIVQTDDGLLDRMLASLLFARVALTLRY